jgi:hypothetical protein
LNFNKSRDFSPFQTLSEPDVINAAGFPHDPSQGMTRFSDYYLTEALNNIAFLQIKAYSKI